MTQKHNFDHFLVVDDDTYVFWERFEEFLSQLEISQSPALIGRTWKEDGACNRLCGGAGWVGNVKLLEVLQSNWEKLENIGGSNYDWRLSRIVDRNIMIG